MIIVIIMISLFVGLGIVFMIGKGAFLIASFNTFLEEEKAKFDITALCKFIGKMTFALAFSMVFWVLGDVLNKQSIFYFGLVLFLAITVFMIVYTNTGGRFRMNIP